MVQHNLAAGSIDGLPEAACKGLSALAAFELCRVCVLQWEPRAFSGDAVAWEKDQTQPEREKHQLEKEYS